MTAGLPVGKWWVLALLVMNASVLPPMTVETGPHPSEKTIRSDKIPDLSSERGPFQERISDPWAGDLQAVLVIARSL